MWDSLRKQVASVQEFTARKERQENRNMRVSVSLLDGEEEDEEVDEVGANGLISTYKGTLR